MQTTDTNLLFQTTAQIAQGEDRNRKKEAAKDVGKPVQVGKVIKLLVEGSEVFVAESGWQARRVSLKVSTPRYLSVMTHGMLRQERRSEHIGVIRVQSRLSHCMCRAFLMALHIACYLPDHGIRP